MRDQASGMTPRQLQKLDQELRSFVGVLVAGMGRAERRDATRQYVQGLLLDGERKSMEPMASRLIDAPSELVAMRQRLQECISVSPWDEREIYRRLALKLEAEMPGVEAFVIDDTGFPKKGKASVGVARQYSGTLAGPTIARSRSACISRPRKVAAASDFACTCRRAGPLTAPGKGPRVSKVLASMRCAYAMPTSTAGVVLRAKSSGSLPSGHAARSVRPSTIYPISHPIRPCAPWSVSRNSAGGSRVTIRR